MLRMPPTISDLLAELSRYADDVERASYHTALNALRRYVATLDSVPFDYGFEPEFIEFKRA